MRIHDLYYSLIINKKVYIYLTVALLIGVFLMSLSKFDNNASDNTNSAFNYNKNNTNISLKENSKDDELANILGRIEGVGETEVFLNYNSDAKSAEYLNGNQLNEAAKPVIEGIIVVAEGGGNAEIELLIKNVISNTFDIPMHKINVLKMKR